jgi:glycosyltransferase involved in cell wall biosynthesis
MKIHFVYAGQPDYPYIQSPYSITKNLYYYLKQRAEVLYYTWDSYSDIPAEPDDIVIGHPHYDPNTTIQRFFASGKKCKAKFTIHPLHTVRVGDNMPFDHLTRAADKVFSICGPYWYDTIDTTPFAHWKDKIIRLDMAVDTNIYKYRKSHINEVGNRGIVYVGSDMPQKNLQYLYEIARRLPTVNFRWYGGNEGHQLNQLPNVKVIGWCDFSNDALMTDIFNFADLFVNVSISDANPTTLLEFGLGGGLIPICTQTSGYWNLASFINIPHNVDTAVNTITEWLLKPEEDLKALSTYNREICERDYTWDIFCSKVYNELEKHF